jgi:RHS repeat-associated protein
MPSDGYVQVMTVNESPNQSVWFDDIELVHQENLITQETHYDAWGSELFGIGKVGKPEHRWKFTGKESIDDLDLGWNDHGARYYDRVLARWHSVDPMADKMRRQSPYNYCFNNPLKFIDPDGMEGKEIKPENEKALQAIRNTLPKDAREYVQVDKKTGFIDKAKLKEYKNTSKSINVEKLKEMANSKEVVSVIVAKEFTSYYEFGGVQKPLPKMKLDLKPMTEEQKKNGAFDDLSYNLIQVVG